MNTQLAHRSRRLPLCILASLLVLPLLLGQGCPTNYGSPAMSPVPTTIVLPGGDVSAPVEFSGNLMFLDATVNGAGPYKFALDTASSTTSISPALASLFPDNLLNATTQITGPSGTVNAALIRIDSLQIGSMAFQNFTATVDDVSSIFSNTSFTVQGIIGIATFQPLVLTLNYPASQIRVQQGVLPDVDYCTILPITGGDLLGGMNYTLPQVSITVAGQAVSCPIDSGNSGWLVLPSSFANLPFVNTPQTVTTTTISGQTDYLVGNYNGTVSIGCVSSSQPPIAVGGSLASLGSQAMMPYVVTIDQTTKRVRFASP